MFKKLKALASGNEEMLGMIDTLEANSKSSVETINNLERKVSEITETRDKYKSGNSLVKSVLGLDTVNEETITEAINALKKSKGDEQSIAEINNLKTLLEKATHDNSNLTSDYESKLQSMALKNSLRDLGLGSLASSPQTEGDLLRHLQNGAVHENDSIVYKNADGTTIYGANGKPLTPAEKLESMKTDTAYAPYFKADARSGTGSSNHSGGSHDMKKYFDSKSPEFSLTKQAEIFKTNPDLYKSLK